MKWCSTTSQVVFSPLSCGSVQNSFPCYSSTPTRVFRWHCTGWSRATIEWVGLSPGHVLNSHALWSQYLLIQSNPDSPLLNRQPVRDLSWRCFLATVIFLPFFFLCIYFFSLRLVLLAKQRKCFFFNAIVLLAVIVSKKIEAASCLQICDRFRINLYTFFSGTMHIKFGSAKWHHYVFSLLANSAENGRTHPWPILRARSHKTRLKSWKNKFMLLLCAIRK